MKSDRCEICRLPVFVGPVCHDLKCELAWLRKYEKESA